MTPDSGHLIHLSGEEPPDPPKANGWVRQNWLALAGLAIWAIGQAYNGGTWSQSREGKELELEQKINQLQARLDVASSTFVRQDVFTEVMKRIDDHLASIDEKVSRKSDR